MTSATGSRSSRSPEGATSKQEQLDKLCSEPSTLTYYDDWVKVIDSKVNEQMLHERAKHGGSHHLFRSLFWRVFLGVLPIPVGNLRGSDWLLRLAEQRETYESLRKSLVVDETSLRDAGAQDDPLNQDRSSRWYRFFEEREMRSEIARDVRRCMPEVDFFQREIVQSQLVNVLYLFCRHSEVPYRQGMHELLAPLLFVLHVDASAFEKAASEHAAEIANDTLLSNLFDSRFLEHDAYSLFVPLFTAVAPWYDVKFGTSATRSFRKPVFKHDEQPFSSASSDFEQGALASRLACIHDDLLRCCDPELHKHLVEQGVAPQVYGVRWLRLLFGREFPLVDLLPVWDALLCSAFALVDHVFCALLAHLRGLLLPADGATCMFTLLHHPPLADVHYLLLLAAHFREPHRTSRPSPPKAPQHSASNESVQKSTLRDWAGSLRQSLSRKAADSPPSPADCSVRRDTLDTVFLVLEAYTEQAGCAVGTLHAAVDAPGNRFANSAQVDAALQELKRAHSLLSATVSDCRSHLTALSEEHSSP